MKISQVHEKIVKEIIADYALCHTDLLDINNNVHFRSKIEVFELMGHD